MRTLKQTNRAQRVVAATTVVVAWFLLSAASSGAAVDVPKVSEVTGGGGVPVVSTTMFDLGDVGYEAAEYSISGTADAYTSAEPLTNDGHWTVTPGQPAPFTTRMVVYRPTDPDDFNGTVIVEWLNVSGGVDAGPDWVQTHTQLIHDGYAWVGVSAQAIGMEATKGSDPERYAALSHPGDSYSYDMFSQAGQAVRRNRDVLGGLEAEHVIAAGESQSAGRLVTYVDAVHPLAKVYDGYLIHSRSRGGAPLTQDPLPAVAAPSPTMIRDDLDVPVFAYQTETDVAGGLLNARQPDTKRFRLWEGAGTSHYDTYGLSTGFEDTGDGTGPTEGLASMQAPTNEPYPGVIECDLPINTGPMHYQLDAVIDHLNRWVATGTPPPRAPWLETATVTPDFAYRGDEFGNTVGGVRSPHVDAPLAKLGGVSNSGEGEYGRFCRLFGTTEPLDATQVASLYPDHAAFVSKWNNAVDASLKAGYLTKVDAAQLKEAAAQSQIGG